jgi:hypothetical protein
MSVGSRVTKSGNGGVKLLVGWGRVRVDRRWERSSAARGSSVAWARASVDGCPRGD